jgi:tRNA A37 threonylcarbamoyltransferase TsaD
MLCLGIESTAHTFGVGIIDEKGRIKANEKSALQTEEGGLIPRELSEHHSQVAPAVVEKALVQAGVDCKDIDVIAFSQGPGIGQALRTGAVAARTLSLLHNKPLVAVNHCIAHIEIGKKLTRCTNPLTVYASGANTQIIGFESSRYRVYGETLDLGLPAQKWMKCTLKAKNIFNCLTLSREWIWFLPVWLLPQKKRLVRLMRMIWFFRSCIMLLPCSLRSRSGL